MTINKAIMNANLLRPDAFSDALKAKWINELEGKTVLEVKNAESFKDYEFPSDADAELSAQSPYDNIYELYIIAMSDLYSGDLSSYGASATVFMQAYEDMKKHYIRKNMPSNSDFIL